MGPRSARGRERGASGARRPAATISALKAEIACLGDEERAKTLRRFFKTGRGEYGEGDRFAGVTVPRLRGLAKVHRDVRVSTAAKLLESPIHEERLLALLIFVQRFSGGGESERRRIYNLYLKQRRYVNNWDLVDLTAPKIVGEFLLNRDKAVLYALAGSQRLWDRRISIVATAAFIKRGVYSPTLEIAGTLLGDKEDLIQKAAGWMLREVGKRDLGAEERFIERHYSDIPRTMLRYAIERFPEAKRRRYLRGPVRRRS